jgi:hypothetical protein
LRPRAACNDLASQATAASATLSAAGSGQVSNQIAPTQTPSTASQGNTPIAVDSALPKSTTNDCAAAFTSLAADIQRMYEQLEQAIELAYTKLIADQQDHMAQLDASIAEKRNQVATPCPPGPQLVTCNLAKAAATQEDKVLNQSKKAGEGAQARSPANCSELLTSLSATIVDSLNAMYSELPDSPASAPVSR